MKQFIAATLVGALAGAAATFLYIDRPEAGSEPTTVVRDIEEVPKMSRAAAEIHRLDRYADLYSIEQILALPSDFAETEALYVLAGRSDSGAVQNLIHEANRIADPLDRSGALSILFSRLSELDPESALAMSRSTAFSSDRNVEAGVWRSWGRHDLDAALLAAQSQATFGQRNVAAQSFYSAFGYMGNEITDRIELELGIRPDSTSRARFIYTMADRSPIDTLRYIEQMPAGRGQQESISWFAYQMSRTDSDRAAGYADMIEDERLRSIYSSVVARNTAAADPKLVLERALASGRTGAEQRGQMYSAMRELLAQDPESALQYFEQFDSSQERRWIGNLIAEELASSNPARAIEWARNSDRPEYLTRVLGQVAATDPQLALQEANAIQNKTQRNATIAQIASVAAKDDISLASSLLDGLPSSNEKTSAVATVFSRWAQKDIDGAIQWLESSGSLDDGGVLEHAGMRLAMTDMDTAMQLLPRLEGEAAGRLRRILVRTLSENDSASQARDFVERYRGTEHYDEMRSSLVDVLINNDVEAARQVASELPEGTHRDSAYSRIILRQASENPAEASRMLSTMSDKSNRDAATMQVAASWYAQNPSAALQWTRNLPTAGQRDMAVAGMARMWHEATPSQNLMIDDISDPTIKRQAQISQIRAVSQRDWQRAQSMLDKLGLSPMERQQLQQVIDHMRGR